MNKLHTLLSGLRDEMVAELDALKLRGVEQAVFTEVLRLRTTPKPDKKLLLQQMGISSTHFDKTCSVLLDKVYHFFAPEGGIQLLQFLGRGAVTLSDLYKNEVIAHINTIQKQMYTIDDLKVLLETLIYDVPTQMSYIDLNTKVADLIVKKSLAKDKMSMRVFTSAKLLYPKLKDDLASQKIYDKEEFYEDTIRSLEMESADLSIEAQTEVLRFKIDYTHAKANFTACIPLIKEAINRYTNADFYNAYKLKIMMEFQLAEVLYFSNQGESAYQLFEFLFAQYPLKQIPRSHYFLTKYIQLCLVQGHSKEAKQLFIQHINSFSDFTKYKIRDLITYIKIAVIEQDFHHVEKYIQQGFLLIKKANNMQYEIELRNMEVFQFAMVGDKSFAIKLCDRNIRFLRQNGITSKDHNFPLFYIVAKAMMMHGKLSKIQQEYYEEWQVGSKAYYGQLLKMVRDKYVG